MFQKIIATSAIWITVPLRLALGLVFIAHGAQKVLGVWGGPGFSAVIAREAPLNLRPAWAWWSAAAFSEFFGGILVMMGLLTRIGAFLIACVMIVAILGAHRHAFFLSNRGMEFALTLFLVAVALIISGGGRASLDRALMSGRRR